MVKKTKDSKIKNPEKKSTKKKKSAKKKSATPPTVEVTITRKILGIAPEEYHFVLADGNSISSLMDLADSFRDMSEEVFRTHVDESKNDFANWILDVFEEPELANEIRGIKNKADAEIVCLRKLVDELKELNYR